MSKADEVMHTVFKNSRYYFLFVIYTFAFIGVLITFGSLLVHNEKDISSNSVHGTSFIQQLATDWTQEPFTDILVVESTVCPGGYTDMYAQTYYGYTIGCDCSDRCCSYMKS